MIDPSEIFFGRGRVGKINFDSATLEIHIMKSLPVISWSQHIVEADGLDYVRFSVIVFD
jgi:hypothetical protein